MDENVIPRIPIGDWTNDGIDWLTDNAKWLFDAFSALMKFLVEGFSEALTSVPAAVMLVIFAVIAWFFRSWRLALGSIIGFVLVLGMRQWDTMLQTMSLVLVSTLTAVILAIPLGIWAAKSNTVSAIVRPIMDFMQTMPAFVYLIPAVTFFSIGVVPGVFSTIIFALPPGVRMTELGIRQVDQETVEAGRSYGATSGQILRGIQIPLAIPTIMAGINQVIMLSLSMAVIAGMVGADGLGKEVTSAISTLDVAQGVEAGLAVVILAVFLDRLTAALGNPSHYPSSLLSLLRKKKNSTS
ncbi:ABC transporter permease [Corynebacterium accolens]|jgi:proline/glycine betaine ABC superfamily ATP binding cassette transporter, permease protein|uniref:Proline/glycine betaine ABC transporter permease n=1 Tax=Corynebacterium accolens TaxID=38284 RepID=A0AAP4BYS8_9CORY|nr:proline/glycine betaine ABC transporter permease [Corynebacterium accolens]EEI14371.1 ABC transporter, permease protein [Corynebacterium accolens ATCC 49725]MDK4246953.1 proline/glycine betaine ABC transporter permease [Corynebacterium accolens]MDK4279304.1 proline/glycine betaine ABC transporter permease [Corynebacterium accolens]MDK4311652.1 proline/glycine betaine ABC transporter permease [Corynebacterium accolens]MDK4322918.1 proline/glycine betaine ABC transporter permease [Corynebacte